VAKVREKVMERSAIKSSGNLPASGAYRNRFGDTLECTFDGPDKINGVMVDYKNWPVSQSPWTAQKTPEGPLTVRNGKIRRVYDFTNWKITSPNP
jgi:hypothetical protein